MVYLTPLSTLLEREPALADAVQALERLAVEQHRLDEAAFRAPQDARDQVNAPILERDRIVQQAYGYGARGGDPSPVEPKALEGDFAALSTSEARQVIELAAATADRPALEQPSRKYLVGMDRGAKTPQAAFFRIDIATWVSPLDRKHPLSAHIEGLLVVSAVRSVVDIQKTPLNTFMALYQHQLSRSGRSARDIMDALDTMQKVWRRALEHTGA